MSSLAHDVVQQLIAQAKQRLYLHAYEITVELVDAPCADEPQCEAECITNFPYLSARLRIFPLFFDKPPARQQHIVRHELAHIITQHTKALCHRLSSDKAVTWQEVLDANEAMTDWVARIAGQVEV